jgi:hypothetical protein
MIPSLGGVGVFQFFKMPGKQQRKNMPQNMPSIFAIFRNNSNGFWDFYHGTNHGCWFTQSHGLVV